MSVPGLAAPLATFGNQWIYRVTGRETNIVLHTLFASPTNAITADLYILSAGRIASSDPANPSLDLSGFAAGTTINVYNEGEIYGAGGDGGTGWGGDENGFRGFYGGGGGGGWGDVLGAAGAGFDDGTGVGDDGTQATIADPDSFGSGGSSNTGAHQAFFTDGGNGGNGGNAISIGGYTGGDSITVNLFNNGEVFGGGGGGAGGFYDLTYGGYDGQDGGDAGSFGSQANPINFNNAYPERGVAGGAVVYSTSGVTVNVSGTGTTRGGIGSVSGL